MSIQFRLATHSDLRRLFYWRNHPKIRLTAINPAPITWSRHCAWFQKILNQPDRALLIASCDEHQLGVIRFDTLNETPLSFDVSIFLAPQHLGKGFGRLVLYRGIDWVRHHKPRTSCIQAKVLNSNLVSQRLFREAGFIEEGTWTQGTQSGKSYVYQF